MNFRMMLRAFVLALALPVLLTGARVVQAETLSGSNLDSRVIVGLSVPADGVQAWMPEGWTSVPFPGGPLAGANLLTVMIDRKLGMDAEGKPLSPPSRRAVAIVGLAKQDDGDAVRMYVLRIYTTAPNSDPYGNAMRADIARESGLTGPADGGRESTDFWRVETEGGGQLVLRLNYTTGARSWKPGERLPYSAVQPDYFRIYRFEQLVDLVMSKAVGKPLNGEMTLESTVQELADIFDGTEEVVAVLDIPVYIRKVFLP